MWISARAPANIEPYYHHQSSSSNILSISSHTLQVHACWLFICAIARVYFSNVDVSCFFLSYGFLLFSRIISLACKNQNPTTGRRKPRDRSPEMFLDRLNWLDVVFLRINSCPRSYSQQLKRNAVQCPCEKRCPPFVHSPPRVEITNTQQHLHTLFLWCYYLIIQFATAVWCSNGLENRTTECVNRVQLCKFVELFCVLQLATTLTESVTLCGMCCFRSYILCDIL